MVAPVCPACGSDDIDPVVGDGRVCLNCGHFFRVVNGTSADFEDEDEDDDGREG